MQTLAEIRAALDEYGLSPRRALGQNFLIEQNLIRRLVDESGAGETDLVLEIGPGTGTLTEELLERGCEVVACELDEGLADYLGDRLGLHTHFTLISGDCLENKRALSRDVRDALAGRPFRLVANLPYGAATPVMLALLVNHPECAGLYVTIQREVADRLLASPSTRAYGSISVVAQTLAEVRMLARLRPDCFWPRPDVESAMVAMERRDVPAEVSPARLATFCQRLFTMRRKQLGSVLGDDVKWPPGVNRSYRAEQLSPAQIVALCRRVDRP